jgi:MFS family permease
MAEADPLDPTSQPEDELDAETAGLARERISWPGVTFRALRHRNYRLYFGGQLVSLIGSWMQTTALLWLAYEVSQEARWPAWIAAAQMLPAFLLGAWAGLLVERWPRRAIILGTQAALLVSAFGLAAMAWSGLATPLSLLVVALAIGCVNALDLPARLAFVVEMVDREDLPNAVALNSMLFNVARAVGPLFTGALLAFVDPGWCFFINGLSFVAVLAALSLMQVPHSEPLRGKHAGLRAILAAFKDLVEYPALALLLVLVATICVFGWPSQSLLPALARQNLGVREGEQGYSLLLCGAGTGAVVAALVLASFTSSRRRRAFICTGIGLTAVGLAGLTQASNLAFAVFCNATIGFGLILFMATSQSVVQLSVDDRNRGRIMGIWSMVINGSVPVGNLVAGPAADHWSVPSILTVQAVGCGAAFVIALAFMRLRSAGK